jgi:hypothetical protein
MPRRKVTLPILMMEPPLGFEVGQDGHGTAPSAVEVHVLHPEPVLGRDLIGRNAGVDPCIVDEDVDPAKFFDDGGDRGGDLIGLGDIHGHAEGGGDARLGTFGMQQACRDVSTASQKTLYESEAEPFVGAGHETDFGGEIEGHDGKGNEGLVLRAGEVTG